MRKAFLTAFLLTLLGVTAYALPPFDIKESGKVAGDKILDTHSYFDVNNLLMFVTNVGGIAEDWSRYLPPGKNDGFYFPYSGSCEQVYLTVVYSAGLFLGGKVNGEIRLAVGAFDTPEYFQGPADEYGNHLPDNPRFRVYKIRRDNSVWLDPYKPGCARDDSSLHFNDWQSWKNEAVVDGAPLDSLGNPLLLGDETLWAVFNDGGMHSYETYGGGTEPLGVEVHQTVWGYDVPGGLGNVLFVKYKLYNKSPNVIDSFYISFWADPDLGGSSDDYVGCDTAHDIFFCYNATNDDYEYGSVPPAWGGKVVYGPVVPSPGDTAIFDGNLMPGYKNLGMTSFNKYINGTDPGTPAQTYGYMQGYDAVAQCPTCPYIDPNTGDTTKFPLAGNPISSEGWIDSNPADRRLMANMGPGTLNPGDSQCVVIKLGAARVSNRLISLCTLKDILDNACSEGPPYVPAYAAETSIRDYSGLRDVRFEGQPGWLGPVNWGGLFFSGGADYGWNFRGGYLDPATMPDSFSTVEIRFTDNDPSVGQRAYSYCLGCTPDYSYLDYVQVPFQVWDVDRDRQLNACFVEWVDSDVFDGTWGPDNSSEGGREYLLVLNSNYDGDSPSDAGTGAINYVTADFSDGSSFDFLYAGWFRIPWSYTLDDMQAGHKLVFDYYHILNPDSLADSIIFKTAEIGDTTYQDLEIGCYSPGLSLISLDISDPGNYFSNPCLFHFSDSTVRIVRIYFSPLSPGPHSAILTVRDGIFGHSLAVMKLVAEAVAEPYEGPVWHVSTAGDDATGNGSLTYPFATIQHAIDASVNGDTVLVHEGTYTGDGNRDIDFSGKSIIVRSKNGPEVTVIDCQGNYQDQHRGFYFHSSEDSTSIITGFTIKNGGAEYGAAIHCSYSHPLIHGNIISGNQAFHDGGGIYCSYSQPWITGNIIRNNSAVYDGAGIYCINSDPAIINNIINDNSSSDYGGGICCYSSNPTITGNAIFKNSGEDGGGGISLHSSSPEIISNTLSHNSCLDWGGAWGGGGIDMHSSNPVLDRSIIAFSTGYGAIFCEESSSPVITCCDIYGNQGGDWITCIADQSSINGNFSADPLFCDTATGDYHIADNSPCAGYLNECGVLIGAYGIGCGPQGYVACDSVQTLAGDSLPPGVYFRPENERWLTGVDWGGAYFNESADYGYNFWGGYLDPSTMPDSFRTVELRFTDNDPSAGQRAYNHLRGGTPNYGYQGYFQVPFEAWDVEDNRQLNVIFIEWVDSDVYDSTWGPDATSTGGREYLLIMNSNYDGDNESDAGTGALNYPAMDFFDGGEYDFLYAAWLRVRENHAISEMDYGQKMLFTLHQPYNTIAPVDSIIFEATEPGQTTVEEVFIKCFTATTSVILLETTDPAFSLSTTSMEMTDEQTLPVSISFTRSVPGIYTAYFNAIDSVSGMIKDEVKLIGAYLDHTGPVWHVSIYGSDEFGDGSESYPFATIQHAINASVNGDTVLVHNGTYTGAGNRDISFGGKLLVVMSENGADSTVIDCQGSGSQPHRGFYFSNGENENAVLAGFTITHGFDSSGGALYCENSSPTIKNCVIKNNYAVPYGGGLYCRSSSPRIIGCEFIQNGAMGDWPAGGGMYCVNSSPYLKECRFISNQAVSSIAVSSGGALVLDSSSAVIEDCLFYDNFACSGGAVACVNGSMTTFRRCLFDGNISYPCMKSEGTAVLVYGAPSDFENCTFARNQSDAVFVVQASATFSNCIFAYNQGYALSCMTSPLEGTASLSCSDIYGNVRGDWVDCIADQADTLGNFSADPLFCDTATGDYHLIDSSRCLPAGNDCQSLIGAFAGCVESCSCGDGNCDGLVNLLDIMFLINYLYRDGVIPDPANYSDVDSSCSINILDITYMIRYLFKNGPPPDCAAAWPCN